MPRGIVTDPSTSANFVTLSQEFIFNLFYHFIKRTAHLAINASLQCVPSKYIYTYTNMHKSNI